MYWSLCGFNFEASTSLWRPLEVVLQPLTQPFETAAALSVWLRSSHGTAQTKAPGGQTEAREASILYISNDLEYLAVKKWL